MMMKMKKKKKKKKKNGDVQNVPAVITYMRTLNGCIILPLYQAILTRNVNSAIGEVNALLALFLLDFADSSAARGRRMSAARGHFVFANGNSQRCIGCESIVTARCSIRVNIGARHLLQQ